MMPFIWNQPPFNRLAMTDIFISYSHKDEAWKDALQRHLKVLQTHNTFSIWDDRQIEVGANWLPAIEGAIEQAKVALLLVSSDFLTSEFVTRQEIPRFLQRREAEGLQVVPIIIRPCAWVTVPWLAALQGGTKDNRPLAQFALGSFESEQAFSEITLKVYNLLQAAQQAAELKRLAELSRLAEQERLEQARLQREAEARRLAQEEAEREAAEKKRLEETRLKQESEQKRLAQEEAEREAAERTRQAELQHQRDLDEQAKREQVAAGRAEQERLAREQAILKQQARQKFKAGVNEKIFRRPVILIGSLGISALLFISWWNSPKKEANSSISTSELIAAEPAKFDFLMPEMIKIGAGSFEMGCSNSKGCFDNEKPVRTVQVAAFEMSKTEVTFAQWDACVADGGCGGYKPDDEQWGRNNRPVINVSWNDAQNYVQWLSDKTKLTYRLPTEAEWEYAARAGTKTSYFWGDAIGKNKANCESCGSQWDDKKTAPVNSFPANAWGLVDMHGNVWEWTQDCYYSNYQSAPLDSGAWEKWWSLNCNRVLRGGSWGNLPQDLRSANRYWYIPSVRNFDLGFRISRTF